MQAYEDMVANPAAREHTVESVHTASSDRGSRRPMFTRSFRGIGPAVRPFGRAWATIQWCP